MSEPIDTIDELFGRALDQPTESREAWLEANCPDAGVRAEIRSLLAAHRRADGFLDAPAAEDELIGRSLGDWAIESELGAGGMGRVYLARRLGPGFEQIAALKVIKRGMDTDDVLRRFRRERRVLAGLDHPGIARLLDGGATPDGRPWFAMEHVEGGLTIDEYCERRGLDLRERLALVRQACDAVHAAHQSLVVHRDLKPGNLLVTPEGRVKLLDFGIARLVRGEADAGATVTDPTAPEARFLTPAWASPEQLRGEPVTTQSDVFALGILLFRLLTGASPWDEGPRDPGTRPPKPSTKVRTLDDHAAHDAAARRRTTPGGWSRLLRGDLDHITLRALAPRPEDRYASAAALAADLGRHLDHEPVEAGPSGVAYRTRKLLRRRPVASALVLAAGLSVITTVAVLSVALVAVSEARTAERASLALARSEQATSAEIVAYLEDLLTSANPFESSVGPAAARDVTVLEVLRRRSDALDEAGIDDTGVEAGIRQLLGRTLMSLGDLDLADRHLTRAVALHASIHGPDHERTLLSKLHLGNLRRYQQRYDESEALYREVAERRLEQLGPDHLLTIVAQANLAVTLFDLGRLQESRELAETTLAWRRANLPPTDPDLLKNISTLGLVLRNLGETARAIELFREEVDVTRSILPADHPQLLNAMNNLAFALHAAERYDEAGRLLATSLERSRRTLGDEHQQTVMVISNLGAVRESQGDLDAAAALYEEAYEIRSRLYGENHGSLGVVTANLGSLHRKAGRLDRALEFYERSVAIHTVAFGPDFFGTAVARCGRGATLTDLGRYDEAEAELRWAHDRLVAVQGPEGPYAQRAADALAELEAKRGRDG